MSETMTQVDPPLTITEAARLLNVSTTTVTRMPGLKWLEWQGAGRRKIRRIDAESVRRLLEGDR